MVENVPRSRLSGQLVKQHLLATVSVIALVGSASAADRPPVVTKAPAAAIAPSWTGPYIGLNAGVAWHKARYRYEQFGPPGIDTVNLTASGATVGGQIGYNWQWQNFVAGVEADINWVDGDGSRTSLSSFSTSFDRLATARVRAGITLSPTLLYVTAGFASGRIANRGVTGANVFVDRGTRSGWTAGGGIEHIFGKNWTAKVEVLYVDLRDSATLFNTAAYSGRFRNSAVVGRFGINLRW